MGGQEAGSGPAAPARGASVHLPLPQARSGCGFWFCCSGFGCFWARGGGFRADYSRLVRFVLLLFDTVLIPGRGSEKPLLPPQINCHIPKLRSSPWVGCVCVISYTVVCSKHQAPPLLQTRGGPCLSAGTPSSPPPTLPPPHSLEVSSAGGPSQGKLRCLPLPGTWRIPLRPGMWEHGAPPLPAPQLESAPTEMEGSWGWILMNLLP